MRKILRGIALAFIILAILMVLFDLPAAFSFCPVVSVILSYIFAMLSRTKVTRNGVEL